MVHKPKHKVHSFRGMLADGGQEEINLERQNLNLAYRVRKLQGINQTPGISDVEYIIKVYRESQSSIDGVIDFNDTDLIACYFQAIGEERRGPGPISIVDPILFSRNIFVTTADVAGSANINYYLEIEEVPVGAATLMQLKLGVARKLSLSENPSG